LLIRVNKAYAVTSPELLFLLCSLPAIEGYAMQGEREEQQLTSSSTSLSSRASAASGELSLEVATYTGTAMTPSFKRNGSNSLAQKIGGALADL
jgi:hypothetical protein